MKKGIGIFIGIVGLIIVIIWLFNTGKIALLLIGSILIAASYYLLGLDKIFGKNKNIHQTNSINMRNEKAIFAEKNLPGLAKQFDETVHIIDTTVKPDIFFSRYEFLIKTLERIIENKRDMGINDTKSIELLEQIEKPENKEEQINDFIKRSHERLLSDMSSLKTDNGRINKAKKYFDEMNEYKDKMNNMNIDLLDSLNKQTI